MSDAEEAIARVQMAQKDGLKKSHKRGVANLDDRILTVLFSLAFMGLVIVWATASSPYIIYGSFAAALLATILFGVLRVKRIHQIREQRERQVKEMQSKSSQ